jgi:hypothetical protein
MILPTVGPNGLQGHQRPRISHAPEYVSSTGPEAIELAQLAGLDLDEWQRYVLTHALGERPDGKWAAQTVGLVVPRQNGKGSVLEARELVGLFLLGERLINHTAHQQKTATNHYKRLLELIQSVPEFDRRIMSAPKGKGNEAIELRGGQTIFFATRSGGGGRGLTADLQVYDEAMYLTEQDRASLAPTMAARSIDGNIQTWYAGSAVDQQDPAQDGVPFAQVRESGIAKANGVAFFEWSVPGDDPDKVPDEVRTDPEAWGQGNPGMGIRIAQDWIEHERVVELGPRAFAVERLGVGDWPVTDGSDGRVITKEQWDPCADTGLVLENPVCLAFEVTPDRAFSAIGACGLNADGVEGVEVIDMRPGTEWVAGRLAELKKAHKPVAILCNDNGPAGALIDEIEKKPGLKVTPVKAGEAAEACGMFYDAVDQGRVRYRSPDVDLDAAVAGAVKRTLGETWAWSQRTSLVNISPLVACTIALWGFRTKKRKRAGVVDLAAALAAAQKAEEQAP